jgi:hypothetical protein
LEFFVDMKANRPNPYIKDIFHWKGVDFDTHLTILDKILQWLEDAGMQVNLDKSTLCSKEVEFLGFLFKEMGYQPTWKRIEAIRKLHHPKMSRKSENFLEQSTLSRTTSQTKPSSWPPSLSPIW